MRGITAQYMNEIVSLTIMALMCVALISAQAGAGQRATEDQLVHEMEVIEFDGLVTTPHWKIDLDFSFRHTGE
ncbi:MAG: hypothetical protein QNJ00_08495 [Woeseiaceae bacterium]|nr:hypothetical protein [Woeseiaceae bacterium]